MESDRWNKWLALAANLGVVAGLVLVAMELRQTRDALLGATYQNRAITSMEWNKWIAESDYIVPMAEQLTEAGWDSLSFEDRVRSEAAGLAAMYRLDGYFYQYELGLLDQQYYDSQFTAEMKVWVPRWREWGLLDDFTGLLRPTFAAEIQRFVDEELRY